jgi:hypothetical protein
MKKIALLIAFAFLGTTASFAQDIAAAKKEIKKASKEIKAQVNGAGMLFENETIDYGTVLPDADGAREFVFINNGNKPLIITNAQGSCGCTVPTIPTAPIAPGAKGIIGVKYDTSRAGQPFTKSVTVTSNAEGAPTKVLTIKGIVSPRETAATAAPKS